MNAKEYLLQLQRYDRIIENTMCEIARYREMAESTGMGKHDDVKVQTTRRHDRMESAIVSYVELEEQLSRIMKDAAKAKMEIISTIQQLPTNEYDVLHKAYVQYKTFYEIANMVDKSYRWVTMTHGKAVTSLQKILDAMKTEKKVVV